MELEENLTNEQLKCKEVIRARCQPLEDEVRALKTSE